MMLRRGQSILEVLVAVAIGALLIIAAVGAIAPALQSNKAANQLQAKAELGNELLNNMRAWAAGNWGNVLALATGTANQYYLNTATSSFTAATGTQSVTLGSTTYTRYFYLSDVYRDTNGNVTSSPGGVSPIYYDPSTKQVTAVVASTTYAMYLTRNVSNAFSQSDWSGGSGVTGPVTFVGSTFTTSTGVKTSVAGQVTLAPAASGTCQF